MEKYHITRLCLTLLICLFCCWNVTAQNPGTTPDEPVLESVSVNPSNGNVTITWSQPEPPASPVTVDGYIIFWLEPHSSNNYVIDSVANPAARSYTFNPDTIVTSPQMPNPKKTTVPFTVAAYHKSPYSRSLRSDEDYNVQLSCKYDSCRAELRLNWYPYVGWYSDRPPGVPLTTYRIMRMSNSGGLPEEIKRVSDQDTSYTITKVNENEQYTFYIEAIAESSNSILWSTSFKAEKYTKMPVPPTFIKAEGTQYDAQGLAQVTFALDPASQTHSYEFLGSSKPDYSFVSLGTFDDVLGTNLIVSDIQTREKTYYYKLEAWHTCKDKYTMESNVATALWLYLRQDEQVNSLQWDPYLDWGIPAVDSLYRRIGNNPVEIIATLTDADGTAYKDDISGQPIEGDICYWVRAVPASPTSAAQQAISNSVCIQPESEIFIPQAFTPNGDGMNDEYRPYFSYDPVEYLFIAYDRNGAKVFQTQNIGDTWDGRLKNGKPANEGVYGYYIKFRTAKGRLVEKRGTFTLVLP